MTELYVWVNRRFNAIRSVWAAVLDAPFSTRMWVMLMF